MTEAEWEEFDTTDKSPEELLAAARRHMAWLNQLLQGASDSEDELRARLRRLNEREKQTQAHISRLTEGINEQERRVQRLESQLEEARAQGGYMRGVIEGLRGAPAVESHEPTRIRGW